MKRPDPLWPTLGLLSIAVTCLLASRPAPVVSVRRAVAFDLSTPLDSMEQFIPDKQVTIHPAIVMPAEHQGPDLRPGQRAGRDTATSAAGAAAAVVPVERDAAQHAEARRRRFRVHRPRPRSARQARPSSRPRQASGRRSRRSPVSTDSAKASPAASSRARIRRPKREGRGGAGRGGIDISLAVGPDHIFEILNGNMAVFSKKGKKYDTTGKLLYGAVPNNTVFSGFGVRCGVSNNSDSVVRYDQLADRWLIVVPVFTRPPDNPQGPYAMCYAVSATSDPLGPYYRYEFQRPLFPDYPRPAVWPDGYYNPTSTSDNLLPDVITQKHDCIAERDKMLKGEPATEQCVVIDGGVFMLNTDLDGKRLPPPARPTS